MHKNIWPPRKRQGSTRKLSRARAVKDEKETAFEPHDFKKESDGEKSPEIADKSKTIIVNNKIDLVKLEADYNESGELAVVSLSAKTLDGLNLLRQAIVDKALLEGTGDSLFSAHQRHIDVLTSVQNTLVEASDRLSGQVLELLAEDLLQAQDRLSVITGRYTADDLLGEIFSRFCIGK